MSWDQKVWEWLLAGIVKVSESDGHGLEGRKNDII